MKARLLDLSISLSGKQRLTVELDGDFRQTYDELHDSDCDFTVKRFRTRRSLDANAYAWVLIDTIAQKKRIGKTEVYRNAIREIGGVSDTIAARNDTVERITREWNARGTGWQADNIGSTIPGWTMLTLYYGSSVYDTSQMAQLIDSLVQDAKALGIETEDENKINSLLEEYENVESHRNSGKARS